MHNEIAFNGTEHRRKIGAKTALSEARVALIFDLAGIALLLLAGCATVGSSKSATFRAGGSQPHPEFTATRVGALRPGLSQDDVRALFGDADEINSSIYGTKTPNPWQATAFVYRMARNRSYDYILVYKKNTLVFSNRSAQPLLNHWDLEVVYADTPTSPLSTVPQPVMFKHRLLDETSRLARLSDTEASDTSTASVVDDPLWWIIQGERYLEENVSLERRVDTLAQLGDLYRKAGMPYTARAKLLLGYSDVQKIGDISSRWSHLLRLAESFAELGDPTAVGIVNKHLDWFQELNKREDGISILLYQGRVEDIAQVHATLAKGLAKDGKLKEAQTLFGQAEELLNGAPTITGVERFYGFLHQAECQTEAGLHVDARRSVLLALKYPQPESMRLTGQIMGELTCTTLARSLINATRMIARAGSHADAQAILREAPKWAVERFDAEWQVWVLTAVARLQQELGDPDGSKETWVGARNAVTKLAADVQERRKVYGALIQVDTRFDLHPLALALALVEDVDESIAAIERIPDVNERAALAADVAQSLAEAQHMSTARRILQGNRTPDVQNAQTLVELAWAWAEVGELNTARDLLDTAQEKARTATLNKDDARHYSNSRSLAISACARGYAEGGNLSGIAHLSDEITDLENLLELYAKHHSVRSLPTWLAEFPLSHQEQRARACLGVARGLVGRP